MSDISKPKAPAKAPVKDSKPTAKAPQKPLSAISVVILSALTCTAIGAGIFALNAPLKPHLQAYLGINSAPHTSPRLADATAYDDSALDERLRALEQAASFPQADSPHVTPQLQDEIADLKQQLDQLKTQATLVANASHQQAEGWRPLIALHQFERAIYQSTPLDAPLNRLRESLSTPLKTHPAMLNITHLSENQTLMAESEYAALFAQAVQEWMRGDKTQAGHAAQPSTSSAIWSVIKQNLESLITIRRIDGEGNADEAAIALAEKQAKNGQWQKVAASLQGLGNAAYAPFSPLVEQIERRQKLLAAISTLEGAILTPASPNEAAE